MYCMLQSVKALLCTVLLHVRMGLIIMFSAASEQITVCACSTLLIFKALSLVKVPSLHAKMWFAFNIRQDHRALQFHFIFTFELNIFVTKSTGVLWSSQHFPTVVKRSLLKTTQRSSINHKQMTPVTK